MVNLVLNRALGVLLVQANQLSDRANETERGPLSRRAMFSWCSYEMALGGRTGPESLETGSWIMGKDISRRKMLSLLGLGAALGFTLSATLEPLEAEAQEAAPAAPATPAAPAATGTRGMQRRQGRRSHRGERRTGRHERRHTRRTGEPAPAAAPAPTQ